jgi:hypothetical protein
VSPLGPMCRGLRIAPPSVPNCQRVEAGSWLGMAKEPSAPPRAFNPRPQKLLLVACCTQEP